MDRKFIEGKVSVIIPIYNAEKYLRKTLDSILVQTYKDIEIVLVDDCSNDDSANIIKEYIQKYPEIVYFLQETNQGAGAARNKALELATGQYVAFLDSDDIWYPNKVAKQLELMKKRNCPFSYTAIEMIDENDNLLKNKRNIKETCDYKYLLHNTIIATSSVIIDRTILGDFRMPLRRGGQDYATWLMLLRNGCIARGINEALVKYRISSNSLSSNKFKSIKQIWEIQTQDEEINKLRVCLNTFRFLFKYLKKKTNTYFSPLLLFNWIWITVIVNSALISTKKFSMTTNIFVILIFISGNLFFLMFSKRNNNDDLYKQIHKYYSTNKSKMKKMIIFCLLFRIMQIFYDIYVVNRLGASINMLFGNVEWLRFAYLNY